MLKSSIIMQKLVKKYGTSIVITFSREERKIHNIELGDILNFLKFEVIKRGRKSVKNNTKIPSK